MGTLGHRALLQYIESNDLSGLKTFLDTRHLPVDDRDEVSNRFNMYRMYFSFRVSYSICNFAYTFCRMVKLCLWSHRPKVYCLLPESC